jgi:hypothetical protein
MPFAHAGLYIDSKSELEAAQSFDIVSDMDMMGAHRRRSNTAQRLDRLKKERRNQAKIKVIHWKDNCYSSDLTGMSRLSLTHTRTMLAANLLHFLASFPPHLIVRPGLGSGIPDQAIAQIDWIERGC